MSRIRTFDQRDIPAVCSLRRKAFDRTTNLEQRDLERYYMELFFANPLATAEFPSFVAEDEDGQIAGFIGVLPRPMTFLGKPLVAAFATELMVSPERRGLIGIALMRKFFSGPQDLCLADAANGSARAIWERLRGEAVHAYCLDWHLPLQPWRQATSELMKGNASGRVRKWLLPAWRALDMVTTGSRSDAIAGPRTTANRLSEITTGQMTKLLPEFMSDRSLIPAYTESSLSWIVSQLALKSRFGRFKARMVRNADGREIGWFLYYVNRGGLSQVLQIVPAKGQWRAVIQALVADAASEGVVTLTGRLDPKHMAEFAAAGCTARFSPASFLVRSARMDLLSCINRGDAFISRVDGEWCVNS